MKKSLVHQIAEDFYSRFESNEQKLERLRTLQRGENTLPQGLEIEAEVKIPDVTQMHNMLIGGVQGKVGMPEVPVPKESVTKLNESSEKKVEDHSSQF